jgi:hypothetical protein
MLPLRWQPLVQLIAARFREFMREPEVGRGAPVGHGHCPESVSRQRTGQLQVALKTQ